MEQKIAAGAAAIRRIVEGRQHVARIPQRVIDEWERASSADFDRATRSHDVSLQEKTALLLLHADLLAIDAVKHSDSGFLKDSLRNLYLFGVYVGRSSHLMSSTRFAALRFAELAGTNTRVPKHFRQEVGRGIKKFTSKGVVESWDSLLSMPEDECRELLVRASRGATVTPSLAPPSNVDPQSESDTSAADFIAAAARDQDEAAFSEPEFQPAYDMVDSNLRLNSIALSGFRGSPDRVEFDFTNRNRPVSAVIFGENGVGKSSIVDAIEFSLQGRVGRSAYFDSPLGPSINSLAHEEKPWTQSKLSDGSSVERTLVVGSGGSLMPSPMGVRPGFLLAPITIKRADILRFLDTEALERGSVLLDYFPADVKNLPVRPEEEVWRLKSQMAELRIKRSSYARRVAALAGISANTVSSRDGLNKYIKDEILKGEDRREFEERGGWEEVDTELRRAISQLYEVMGGLTTLRKRSEVTVQPLNPVAHGSQIHIIKDILRGVGGQISRAFSEIASEHPIENIDVVFGESGPLSLDVVVTLENGRHCFPQQLFSEAYRDLLALLFFISVALKASERGQSRVLILDDVLQSVDAKIRHSLTDYLLTHFAEWQLIFTVHDRLWYEQLKDLMHAHMHEFVEHRIVSWDFDSGPKILRPGADPVIKDLKDLLLVGEPRVIGALAGQALEAICDQLSWRLQLKVARKEGDRYTLADLWPVVRDRLSSTATVRGVVRRIEAFRRVRNLTVHADSMSLGLSQADAQNFGKAVIDLYEKVHCEKCRAWVRGGKAPQCSCKTVRL